MRALVQRVKKASVTVNQETVALIGPGLLVFLGVGEHDEQADAEFLAGKVARMRVFRDQQGKMNNSVSQVDGQVLVVSQFTLYGDMKRGNRPSFSSAAGPEKANQLYLDFCEFLRRQNIAVQTGQFAAMMDVSLVNDGPVTILLESDSDKKQDSAKTGDSDVNGTDKS